MEEEGHADGNQEAFPLRVGEAEVGERAHAARDAFVLRLRLAAEENGARLAGAEQLAGRRLEQVRVVGGQVVEAPALISRSRIDPP